MYAMGLHHVLASKGQHAGWQDAAAKQRHGRAYMHACVLRAVVVSSTEACVAASQECTQ